MPNHFDLFGLAPAFALESEALERSYREIQSRVHPDRFAHAGDAERRASLQWTTRVNEAYRTLKDPVQRARAPARASRRRRRVRDQYRHACRIS